MRGSSGPATIPAPLPAAGADERTCSATRDGASVFADGTPGRLVHPPGTDEQATAGWQVLRLD